MKGISMKKYSIITVILLFVVFVFALSACSDNGDEVDKSGSESPKTSVSEKISDDSEISAAQYTVYFKSDGEIIYETKVKSGETLETPEAPTKNHYFLSGWYKGGEKWDFKADKVVSDITLVAKWAPEVYTVTFVTEAGDTPTSQTVTYDPVNGKVVEPTIEKFVKTAAYEYEFVGWYFGDTKWNFDNIVAENMKLVARWNKNTAIGVLPDD